jgi:hypothetical protein
MQPMSSVATVNLHSAQVTGVPPGLSRVLEVRAYNGDPTNSQVASTVLSVGRSTPFDVSSSDPFSSATPATIVLRRVNLMVPVGTGAGCVAMTVPRAAHTATLLSDGRVFVAGGLTSSGGATSATASTELFDPVAETFTLGPNMGAGGLEPRAFHTGSPLPDGEVLLVGGESSGGSATALLDALAYDPGSNVFTQVALAQARTRHAATAVADGVAIVGGLFPDGGLVGTVEWYNPGGSVTQDTGVVLPLTSVAVAALDGGTLLVAGGTDGGATSAQVLVFLAGSGALQQTGSAQLATPRSSAAVAPYPDGVSVAVFGGYPDPTQDPTGTTLSSSEIISLSSGSPVVTPGPVMHSAAALCAAPLFNDQVLVAGGVAGSLGAYSTVATAELFTQSKQGAPTSLGMPQLTGAGRTLHTCTGLSDGSALFLGGLDESTSPPTVLQDAYIFMPAPEG